MLLWLRLSIITGRNRPPVSVCNAAANANELSAEPRTTTRLRLASRDVTASYTYLTNNRTTVISAKVMTLMTNMFHMPTRRIDAEHCVIISIINRTALDNTTDNAMWYVSSMADSRMILRYGFTKQNTKAYTATTTPARAGQSNIHPGNPAVGSPCPKSMVIRALKNTISMSQTKTTHWGRGALRKCLMIRQSAMLLIILLRIRV